MQNLFPGLGVHAVYHSDSDEQENDSTCNPEGRNTDTKEIKDGKPKK